MQNIKPVVQYDPNGESGNIYHILGKVQQVMKSEEQTTKFNEARDRVFKSSSYDLALKVLEEVVTLEIITE